MLPLYQHLYTALAPLYGNNEARALAFWVMEECGYSRTQILTGTERGCKDTKNIPNIKTIIERLLKKEPIQYIFGHTDWAGLRLKVTPDTLIPRPETAELVALVEQQHNPEQALRVLDIGTGSGILGILGLMFGAGYAYGTDLDPCAEEAVRENCVNNGIDPDRFKLVIGNIATDKELQKDAGVGTYDIVVANILAEVLEVITPCVPKMLKEGGIYITSGILNEKENIVTAAMEKAGLKVLDITRQGEWSSVTAAR